MQISLDNGETWEDLNGTITGLIAGGDDGIDGIYFTSSHKSLPQLVDTTTTVIIEASEACDDPITGVVKRSGAEFWLHITDR